MALDSILNTSISGLNAAQTALRVTSNNIVNVNTPHYARKVATQESLVLGAQGAGVTVAQIQRIADSYLERSFREATSDSEYYRAENEIYTRLQALFGDPAANTSLSGKLDELFSALANLPLDPASPTRRREAVTDLKAFGDEISRLATEVQDLRSAADQRVAGDIATVNAAILRLYELNSTIQRETLLGNDTGALEDQRAAALAEISGVVDITTYELSNGGLAVATTAGTILLDYTPRELQYNPVAVVDPTTPFAQITVHTIDPVSGAVSATGQPLDPAVRSGSLRGWLDMRNTELPLLADQLGELAAKVVDQLNAIHNESVAVPPPNSMTGRNTGLLGTDALGFTGSVSFHVLAADETIAATATVNLGAYATVNAFVTAMNTNAPPNGVTGFGTFSFASGALTFTATNPAFGVAIQQGSPAASRGGQGFAHFFGMNDLMTAGVRPRYDTGFTSADAHGFGATGTLGLNLVGPSGQEVSYSLDFSTFGGATMGDIVTDLNTNLGAYATFSLDANGHLSWTPTSNYSGWRLQVASDSTARGATGMSFSELFGLGEAYGAGRAFDVAVRSDILADPALMAFARVDTAAAAGVPAVTESDSRGAVALQDLATASVAFASAGDLPAATMRLGDYAAQLLAHSGSKAASAEQLGEDRLALTNEISTRLTNYSGVNLDEELSNMIVFQTAYNAAARMMTTAREMYDTLLNI